MARRRGQASQQGQAVVEFGLILPIFIVMVLAVVDFGWALRAYVTINNAVREGARYGITCKTDAAIRDHVVEYSSNLLTTSDVDLSFTPSPNPCAGGIYPVSTPVDGKIQVQVTYTYSWITPIVGMANFLSAGAIPDDLALTAKSTMRFE